jgi:nucleoside-diphosphate-sugar epimerase
MKMVVVAGGTGYMGKPLIEKLGANGFRVAAVARPKSAARLPAGCEVIAGDVLDARTYQDHVPTGATFVHLVGTPHPAPWKGAEFRSVDLVSLDQSLTAAKRARAKHFVFVSVAHPAPVMKAFIEIRTECEPGFRSPASTPPFCGPGTSSAPVTIGPTR